MNTTRFQPHVRLFCIVLTVLIAAPTWAQDKKKRKPPVPENLLLRTKDGVNLQCTYFPGTMGKNTVPIIMLHGFEGQRGDYAQLAIGLQKMGHAVMLPDLRGHGRSLKMELPGGEVEIDLKKMRKADFAAMLLDVQACKKHLMAEHNKGKVNIELLCVIGADMGALVAMNWAAYDWNARQLPAYKQGRDVKALVLLSPPKSFKGVNAKEAAAHPVIRSSVSILIAAGKEDRTSYSNAKRLHNGLERFRDIPKDPAERREKQNLFFVEPETSLVGTDLLKGRGLTVMRDIAGFITLRLVNKQKDWPWAERKSPLSGG